MQSLYNRKKGEIVDSNCVVSELDKEELKDDATFMNSNRWKLVFVVLMVSLVYVLKASQRQVGVHVLISSVEPENSPPLEGTVLDEVLNDTDELETTVGIEEAVEQTPQVEPVSVATRETVNVCVSGTNPRVASVFIQNYFRQFGGKLNFVLDRKLKGMLKLGQTKGIASECDPSWPSLKLSFQNSLSVSVNSPGATRVVAGDEFCKCSQCNSSGVSFRQYFTTRMSTPYLPLGPRYEFVSPARKEIKSSGARKFIFNFMGAPTSQSRKELVTLIESKTGEFSKEIFVHLTPRWKKDPSSSGYIAPEQYRTVLLDSVFTLCPAGNNPEAFRIFEAIDSGSIPIIVLDESYKNHTCKDAFRPLLESGAPFITLKNWQELPERIRELETKPSYVGDLQTRLGDWRQKFWSNVTTKLECTILENHQQVLNPGHYNYLGDLCKNVSPREPHPKPELSLISTPRQPKKIPLVTGCGRSGTLSIMEYLRTLGVKALHEDMRPEYVSVSWLYAADANAYPFENALSRISRKKLRKNTPKGESLFGPVVLVTRHPLKVMSSTRRCFCGRGDRSIGAKADFKSWRFVENFVPEIDTSSPLEDLRRSALYWLEWNKRIDSTWPNRVHVRLEDVDPGVLVSGLQLEDIDVEGLPHRIPSAKGHTSPQKEKLRLPDVTWRELHNTDRKLATQVLELAQSYGYEAGKTLEELLLQS
mmetsp:Transcript_4100/g.6045  ORF Transcript_4100/g.6045 Transcript_4100/m.6045 type:complete len:703 (-) Transcript_4100:2613-4721(-)|eukprot:CAMPEP_0203746884 /NCGR_PEP_ID=MMETSP0098-20131031/2189_1 /ASSEMBLY_ACC=CAM_ASM_000208 /TAXON_ID=96639 /ORGANISM=" , Strain NY0313808BC1" /LENGTH=702 /DNA_ID=CAMNT_0050635137 /DNA_START=1887 /DNA_END=3995 /DNA_ORIENTATION=+